MIKKSEIEKVKKRQTQTQQQNENVDPRLCVLTVNAQTCFVTVCQNAHAL